MAVKTGEAIPITLQVSDDDAAVFPRAVVYDNAGIPLVGSPVNLAHVASGFYRNQALAMPSTPRVFVQIKVYQDSGFTVRHPIHADTLLDVIERDTISDALDALLGVKGDLTGFVEDSPQGLLGLVSDDGLLSGEFMSDDGLFGIVEELELLTGTLFDNEAIQGIVIDC